MCQNVFKNDKEKERKKEFTKLFVMIAQSAIKGNQSPVISNSTQKN